MIWLRTAFHGDDKINKLRTMRNLFRSGFFKQQNQGKGTDRRKMNSKKKDKGRNCIMPDRKKKRKRRTNQQQKKKEL